MAGATELEPSWAEVCPKTQNLYTYDMGVTFSVVYVQVPSHDHALSLGKFEEVGNSSFQNLIACKFVPTILLWPGFIHSASCDKLKQKKFGA